MKPTIETRHFVYQTKDVCPPEIHFQLSGDILESIRFVGGGCPGNAQMVTRLLAGRTIDAVLPLLEGIKCRNDTSCPDQLANALGNALSGRLEPSDSFRLHTDDVQRFKIGLIGDLDGNANRFEKIFHDMRPYGLERVLCIGNVTGPSLPSKTLIKMLKQRDQVTAVLGDRDWAYSQGNETGMPALGPKERDWLVRRPQVQQFRMGSRMAMAFYGDYLQSLPGFSDFEPFALEINMVCGLTRFMQDETVFPALEAMIPQFQADIILFGQERKWGHWHIGKRDFISIGSAVDEESLTWGLLEAGHSGIRLKTVTVASGP